MTIRICSHCGESYGDGWPGNIYPKGPHPYERCLEILEERQDKLLDQLMYVRRDIRSVRQRIAGKKEAE